MYHPVYNNEINQHVSPLMNNILLIAIGGAFGSVMRYLMSNAVYSLVGRNFPYGTLAVNVLGSFIMGFLFILFLERFATMADSLRALFLIGVLGGFTTFSSFSIETFNLFEGGQMVLGCLNILGSVGICLAATALGVLLGKQL